MQRLAIYLRYLQNLPREVVNVSPNLIANDLMITPKIVRQDMQILLEPELLKKADRSVLIQAIRKNMYFETNKAVVLVGVGKLGKALLGYAGFSVYGLDILAGFDIDMKTIKKGVYGKPVYHISRLDEICHRLNAKIAIVTTSGDSAQIVCDALVKAGVVSIWNYSSVRLKVPNFIMVYDERMADTLQVLAAYAEKQSDIQQKTDEQEEHK